MKTMQSKSFGLRCHTTAGLIGACLLVGGCSDEPAARAEASSSGAEAPQDDSEGPTSPTTTTVGDDEGSTGSDASSTDTGSADESSEGSSGGPDMPPPWEDPLGGMELQAERIIATSQRTDRPFWRASTQSLLYRSDDQLMQWSSETDPMEIPIDGAATLACRGLVDMQRFVCHVESAESGTRQWLATDGNGRVEILADVDAVEGSPTPNDIVVSPDGTVYYTNRCDGHSTCSGAPADALGSVLMVRDGAITEVDRGTGMHPNGIALGPDGTSLYVAYSAYADAAQRAVVRFEIAADGSLGEAVSVLGEVPANRPDGIAVDVHANVFVSAADGNDVEVWSALDGTSLGRIQVASSVNNIAFGGEDGRSLFITTHAQGVYRVEVLTAGANLR